MPHQSLDLLLVLGINGILVLGPEKHGGVIERRIVKATALTLDHGRGQNRNNVRGKFAYILGYAAEETRRSQMIAQLDLYLDEHVTVQIEKILTELGRNLDPLFD